MNDIFKISKQLRSDNQDVVGDKYVKDDSCKLSIDNEAKKVAWKQHYERLLNEFSWNSKDLTADSVAGPPILITIKMMAKAIMKMKNGKAAGSPGIAAEMLKASGDTGVRLVAELTNDMIKGKAML